MPLVSICGSQGQGKSTVLTALGELGYNIIPQKTSRSILNEWGYTLNEVNKDPELTKKFQDECLIRHKQNNLIGLNSQELYFTERSYADIFSYTLFALGSFNEYSEWLDEYYEKCKVGQKMYYAVIRLAGRTTNVENDGVRSVNKYFTQSFDIILKHFIEDFGVPMITVDTPDHDKRISIIRDFVK